MLFSHNSWQLLADLELAHGSSFRLAAVAHLPPLPAAKATRLNCSADTNNLLAIRVIPSSVRFLHVGNAVVRHNSDLRCWAGDDAACHTKIGYLPYSRTMCSASREGPRRQCNSSVGGRCIRDPETMNSVARHVCENDSIMAMYFLDIRLQLSR